MSKTEMTAVVRDGMLKPDGTLPFPEDARVRITVESIGTADERLAAWERLLARFDAQPIKGDGKRFNREALYDRD